MRRPHVYERSAPRGKRESFQEPAQEPAEVVRAIALQLGGAIEEAEAAGLKLLAYYLDVARREAVKVSEG
jgi:hypothetical protein